MEIKRAATMVYSGNILTELSSKGLKKGNLTCSSAGATFNKYGTSILVEYLSHEKALYEYTIRLEMYNYVKDISKVWDNQFG